MKPNVHSSTIYNSQVLEVSQVPISKWVDQKTVVHLHNGILHTREKEGAPTLWDSMDGTGEYMLTEVSQTVKDKYHMISPISGTYEQNKQMSKMNQRQGNKEQTDSDQSSGGDG